MKAMKKTIAVLLTLCMVISMLAVAAVTVSAEDAPFEPGYYLIGTFSDWHVNSNCIRLTINPNNPYEYVASNQRFEAGTRFKAIYTEDGTTVKENKWYGGNNNDDVTLNDAGTYNIYFRNEWYSDWNGYLFAQRIPVAGYSLGVGNGDISFNVFFVSGMNVNKAKFTWTGPNNSQREQIVDVVNNTVTCGVPAAEMTAPIVIDYSYDNGQSYVSAPGTQTVAAIANQYIEGDFSPQAKALAKAILVYGAAAQKQFSFRENDPATQDTPAEYAADDIKYFIEGDTGTPTGNVQAPFKGDLNSPALDEIGLKYEGCTLLLQSKPALRFYFTKTADFSENTTTVNYGFDSELKQYGTGKYWYVTETNISMEDLDKAELLNAVRADDGGSTEIDLGYYSTLSYVKAALTVGDDTLKTTVRAFYGLYLAAQNYQRTN